MARLGLIWELGDASGYAALMALIVKAARAEGHTCIAIVRDLHVSAPIFDAQRLDLPLVQAPLATPTRVPPVRVQTSYATLLHNCGFGDGTALAARLRAWQTLYHQFDIERVLLRHSPTALLAARLAGLPTLHYGTGFSMPPVCHPMPAFHPELAGAERVLLHNESKVLIAVNEALRQFGAAPLTQLADFCAGLMMRITGYTELDHYARSDPPMAIGLPDLSYGDAPVWPSADAISTRRIFASMLPVAGTGAWLQCLARLPVRALLYPARGLQITQLPPGLALPRGTVHFGQAIAQSDAVFGYASHNLVCEALLRGRPLALLAHSPEHLMLARRVQALGAGILLPDMPGEDGELLLREFLDNPSYAQRATAFAARYGDTVRATVPRQLLEAALAAAPAPIA